MSISISGIKTSGDNQLSLATTATPNPSKKEETADSRSATIQSKTDTLELSEAARTKQSSPDAQAAAGTNGKTQLSTAAEAKQLYQQGQTVAQIAAKLGLDVATVKSYLGITADSSSETAAGTQAAVATGTVKPS